MTLSDLTFIDTLGILGSLIIAAAYFAVSNGKVDAQRPAFHIINIIGAGLILLSLYYRPNPGAILMEGLWVLIALQSLIRFFLRRD